MASCRIYIQYVGKIESGAAEFEECVLCLYWENGFEFFRCMYRINMRASGYKAPSMYSYEAVVDQSYELLVKRQ